MYRIEYNRQDSLTSRVFIDRGDNIIYSLVYNIRQPMSSNSVRGGGFRRVYMWNKFDLRTQWWPGWRLLCIKMIHTHICYIYIYIYGYVYVYINEIWTGGGQRNARQYTMPALHVQVDWTPRAVARCHQFTQYANILPTTLYIFIV